MNRDDPQPGPSGTKRKRTVLFTTQDVIDYFEDLSELDNDNDADYPASDLDSDSDNDDRDLFDSESHRSSEVGSQQQSADQRGRVPTDSGDVSIEDLDGWSKQYHANDTNFDDSECGPRNLPTEFDENSNASDYISLFLDDEFWDNFVDKTNLRATQIKEAKPNYYFGRVYKEPLTVEEAKAFLGLRLQMEGTVIKPQYREYWETDGQNFLSETPGFRQVMPRDRWLSIWTFLHVVDETDEAIDRTDAIYKVRPFLNMLLEKFRHYYVPRQQLSLDEAMIPLKNRLAIKQYIKDKPAKFGVKSFVICEGETGYIIGAEVYTGRTRQEIDGIGITGNVVNRLLTSAEADGKHHILVMDRYYNSFDLFKFLLTMHNTLAVGTAMTNRKNYPQCLVKKKMKNRGDFDFCCKDGVVAMVWNDKKPINFLSTCHDPNIVLTADRRCKDGSLVQINMPLLVKDYNKYMGGTDKNDQITRLYRTRRHHRWPRRLFIKFVLWAVFNAYVIFQSMVPQKAKSYSFRKFIDEYCLQLVGAHRNTAVVRRARNPDLPERLLNVGLHMPQIPENDSTNHLCAVCAYKYNKYKRENPNVPYKDYPVKAVKSSVRCTQCDRYFCIKRGSTCWIDWHTKVEFWR